MDKLREEAVVIVGAGPSGLALAIELGSRGVDCLLVERNDRVGHAPRAKTTNVRTRTHLRRWGIADKLADAAPFGVDYPATVSFVTRLGGFALAHIENHSNINPGRNDLYPEHGQWVPQYTLEQVMREHAETLPSSRTTAASTWRCGSTGPSGRCAAATWSARTARAARCAS